MKQDKPNMCHVRIRACPNGWIVSRDGGVHVFNNFGDMAEHLRKIYFEKPEPKQ